MEGYNEFWKTLFTTLFNNPVADEKLTPMWKQFKSEHLTLEDLKEAFKNGKTDFSEKAQDVFQKIKEESSSSSEFLYRIKDDPSFENTDWGVLFKKIRDRESSSLDSNRTLEVISGGVIRSISWRDLENNFEQENPNILVSQVCVPETLIHEDTTDPLFNKETMVQSLKIKYEKILEEKREQLVLEQPHRREEEIEKQASKAAEEDTMKTREANALQLRESLCAEELVQKSIFKERRQN